MRRLGAPLRNLPSRWALARMRRRARRRLGSLGPGSVIVPPVTVLCPERVEIGARVLVMEGCHFSLFTEHGGRSYGPRVRIADGTVVGPRCWVSCVGEIEIGREVALGAGVLIADAFHEYAQSRAIVAQPMRDPAPVRLADGAFVGPGAAILAGVSVGRGAYVLPGAVVAEDVPERAIAAGNPAEVIRRPDSSGEGWIDSTDPRWAPLLGSVDRGAARAT